MEDGSFPVGMEQTHYNQMSLSVAVLDVGLGLSLNPLS